MTPQERDVISGIFDRLREVEHQPRDPEAQRFIADLVARQPYAPYAMAQALFVQEQALKQFNERVRQLEEQLKEAAEARGTQESGGFLSGLFGGGRPESPGAAPPRTSVPQAGMGSAPQYGTAPQAPQYDPGPRGPQYGSPWGGQQPQQPAGGGLFGGGGGGGFLQGAMATAAGVAGGALLFQGLRGMFGGHGGAGQAFGNPMGFGDPAQMGHTAGVGDSTSGRGLDASADDATVRDASYDDSDSDDDDDDDSGDGGDDWV